MWLTEADLRDHRCSFPLADEFVSPLPAGWACPECGARYSIRESQGWTPVWQPDYSAGKVEVDEGEYGTYVYPRQEKLTMQSPSVTFTCVTKGSLPGNYYSSIVPSHHIAKPSPEETGEGSTRKSRWAKLEEEQATAASKLPPPPLKAEPFPRRRRRWLQNSAD